jgi:hypothetical protein
MKIEGTYTATNKARSTTVDGLSNRLGIDKEPIAIKIDPIAKDDSDGAL